MGSGRRRQRPVRTGEASGFRSPAALATRRWLRGHSSAGRAPALHAGGREFDPPWLHQTGGRECLRGIILPWICSFAGWSRRRAASAPRGCACGSPGGGNRRTALSAAPGSLTNWDNAHAHTAPEPAAEAWVRGVCAGRKREVKKQVKRKREAEAPRGAPPPRQKAAAARSGACGKAAHCPAA